MDNQEYDISSSRTKDGISLSIIALNRKGTHDNYDVLFNSECSSEYFDSELSKQRKIVDVLEYDERRISRYNMCEDQPAQIDCRCSGCIHHKNGACNNISPAITLNHNGTAVCWSMYIKK
jgi:hypothetical protein